MAILLPRLPDVAAKLLLEAFLANPWAQDRDSFDPTRLPEEVRYASTGGTWVSGDELRKLHSDVVAIAQESGYPGAGRYSEFDFRASVYLAESPLFMSGEALRDDVWSFVSIVMFPGIVSWRFRKDSRERYFGGVRNAFQRLWTRARALDRGAGHSDRWGLLRDLTEDALVQITERPSIGADPRLARQLAEAWVRAKDRYGREDLEDVMRGVTKLLRMRNVIRAYAVLPDQMLAEEFDELFSRFARKKKGTPPLPRLTKIPVLNRLLRARS